MEIMYLQNGRIHQPRKVGYDFNLRRIQTG